MCRLEWELCSRSAPCDFCGPIISMQHAANLFPCGMVGCTCLHALPGKRYCKDCTQKVWCQDTQTLWCDTGGGTAGAVGAAAAADTGGGSASNRKRGRTQREGTGALALDASPGPPPIELDASVERLRKMCTSRGLLWKGSKVELVQRLRDWASAGGVSVSEMSSSPKKLDESIKAGLHERLSAWAAQRPDVEVPSKEDKTMLAHQSGVQVRWVEYWFWNRNKKYWNWNRSRDAGGPAGQKKAAAAAAAGSSNRRGIGQPEPAEPDWA